jgi:poly(ADP-ribose) glycohydrolase ARH3
VTSQSRCRAALLGTAIGDAFGCPFEGASPGARLDEQLRRRADEAGLWGYTDDAEMMIGVAEALLEGLDADNVIPLLDALSRNYEPARGYGKGMKMVLDAFARGADWQDARFRPWPDGSRGNGAAVRTAPIACVFERGDPQLIQTASAVAAATHAHPDAVDGAVLHAVAVAHVLALEGPRNLASVELIAELRGIPLGASSWVPRRLDALEQLLDRRDRALPSAVGQLGHGVLAEDSVVAALYAFLVAAPDFREVVVTAAMMGGDVDTITAMSGSLGGALVGVEAIPAQWICNLENQGKGRDYIRSLADRLWAKHEAA